MTPLERAAQALEAALPDATDIAQGGFYPDDLKAGVRAVLTAIREPSEGMLDAAIAEDSDDLRGQWRAMIDVVLAEGE